MSDKYTSRQERKQAEKTKTQPKGKKPSKKGSLFKKIVLVVLFLLIVSVGAGAVSFAAMIKNTPPIDPSKLANPLPTKFYDKNGKLIYEYGEQMRTDIKYSQLPKMLEHAYISAEDANFYQHGGVDIRHTLEAIFANLTGGFGSEGGSTITQQLVKNSLLTPQKTIQRKVEEWYLADKMEQMYSKQQILTMYLNKIYLGDGAYGVAAAAQDYYGIDANHLSQLTLPEMAMLAGLPQGPSGYDPRVAANRQAATDRRNYVLQSMQKQGYITQQQMKAAENTPVATGLVPPSKTNQPMPYQGFLDAVVKQVEAKLPDVDISTAGLSVYTTLDPQAQDYADKLLNTNEIIYYPNSRFQGAFVFMDNKTGEVRAIGSGRNDYQAHFKGTNFAIDLKRQPGSSFKPIFDYGPAIENLKWSTGHLIDDKATTYSNGQPIQNWDHAYHGWLSIRTALAESYNIPALLTLQTVGLDNAKSFAENLGISFPQNQVYESYAIGSNTVNPLEMAGAYSAFADGGIYKQPTFVQKVVYPDGKTVSFEPESKKVMHAYTSYLLTDMMRSVVHTGTGTSANVSWLDVAGKTGTTNFDDSTIAKYGYPSDATNDSWFVGYTPQYTMAVWTGYPQNGTGNYLYGNDTHISQYMFRYMMENFGTDTSKFQQPYDVYRAGNELYVDGGEGYVAPPVNSNNGSSDSSKNTNQNANGNDANGNANSNANGNNANGNNANGNTNANANGNNANDNANSNGNGNTNQNSNVNNGAGNANSNGNTGTGTTTPGSNGNTGTGATSPGSNGNTGTGTTTTSPGANTGTGGTTTGANGSGTNSSSPKTDNGAGKGKGNGKGH